MENLIECIKNPVKTIIRLDRRRKITLSDKLYLKLRYKQIMGRKLNINNPKTFNEKLQWLKLYDRKSEYTNMVDKYEVRKYIQEKIGKEYLIPLLGVYDNFDDINFDKLPNKFVIKCNHDSGGVVICKDKESLDIAKVKERMSKALNSNYYYFGREWPYKNIKPKLIIEEYMEDAEQLDLKDYKFMCFNGKVKCSFVCSNRNSKNGLCVDFFDLNWNHMPFKRHYPNSLDKISKPLNYDTMIKFSEILSKDIPFVRVDFYEIKGKLYFGELTFYPGSGFEEFTPYEYDELLGDWLELPEKKIIDK